MPLPFVVLTGMSNWQLKEVDVKASFNMEDITINVLSILLTPGNITIVQWPDGMLEERELAFGVNRRGQIVPNCPKKCPPKRPSNQPQKSPPNYLRNCHKMVSEIVLKIVPKMDLKIIPDTVFKNKA